MNPVWQAALGQAVRDVLEQQCFMLPAAEPGEDTAQSRVVLEVDFSGSRQGLLRLSLPDTMVEPIALAMLGEDGPLPLDEQYEAVCELANIVCGNVLPLVLGERAVCELASPRVIAIKAEEDVPVFDAEVDVALDEGLVSASIAVAALDGPAA
jgi:CheY-specific phosphatase CheX